MGKNKFCFPLGIQIKLPEDYRTNETFKNELKVMQDLGLSGLELNIAEPKDADYKDIVEFLDAYGMKFTMFASGLCANTYGLSLSHENEDTRKKSVAKFKEIIDFVAGTDTGIIIGFFKGVKVDDKEGAIKRFEKSMSEFAPYAVSKKVKVLVEATNRYESSVSNSLEDAYNLVKDYDSNYIHMLPDTYHMNIEEADMYESLTKYAQYYKSVHLSDNNRFLPGYGAIDFKKVIKHLKKIGYDGRVALEGNFVYDLLRDVEDSANYLNKIM